MLNHASIDARFLTISGRVQGVGFRPFVMRLAHELSLTGWVLNRAGHVEIFVQGDAKRLEGFAEKLITGAPPLAQPVITDSKTCSITDANDFRILRSLPGDPNDAHIPPDYFICDDCLAEMHDPQQRRYRYPFINCTQCGPRYTLIARLPYDRNNTSMDGFTLCADCRYEYENDLDRRFHAQPLACPLCGPALNFIRPGKAIIDGNEAALAACIAALRAGEIVAVKGIGGYHLLCDAGSDAAVKRLRERKRRPGKPFAVLLPWRGEDGLDAVREYADPNDIEAALLTDPLRPIVLIKKRTGSRLSAEAAPGIGEIGILLPYSPLHHLLSNDFGGPLVATSANIGGEPVMTGAAEVERRLGPITDAFLHHDRPILRPADDAVFRNIAGKMRPLRLGRGCTPFEMTLPFALSEPMLAVGAHMKNTVALAWHDRIVVSPHIGDLGSRRSQEVFEQTIADIATLYGVEIKRVIRDAHPDYRSSRWAEQAGLPVDTIFHHHAHAAALAGEHGLFEPMLAFTWDGTGFGEDGSIWGGEALLGNPGNWRRVASLMPFRIPGGDAVAREPWRAALALCWEAGLEWPDCPYPSELLEHAWTNRINAPQCSSAGRLFDAAAALLGIILKADYDGQGPMQLEALSANETEGPHLPLLKRNGLWLCDWAPLLPMLLDGSSNPRQRAGRFHAGLADALCRQARKIRDEHGINKIGLCGGVFQNKRLTEQTAKRLQENGFEVYLSEQVPCNDAGISFGQIVEAGQVFRH